MACLLEQALIVSCDLRGDEPIDRVELEIAVAELAKRNEFPKCVQRNSVDDLPAPLSTTDGVVAYYLLEITQPSRGFILLLHTTATAPRGFTLLCQTLGAQMVEAAEPLLAAAALRDRMRSDLDRAQSDARRDRLTGLANRLAWDEAIAATTQSHETPAAVVMVDGGGLKAINDTYGHQVGDELLCAIAGALNSCVRVGDVVARLGGDEFALLLADADESVTDAIVSRIEATISAARLSNGLGICVAIGSACERGGDLVMTQHIADTRMLQAKRLRARVRRLRLTRSEIARVESDGVPPARPHRSASQPALPRRDDVRRVGQHRPRRVDPDHPLGARRRDQLHRHRGRLLTR